MHIFSFQFVCYHEAELTIICLAKIPVKAGIPDGVLNVITGFGPTAGAAISSHMDMDMVIPSFPFMKSNMILIVHYIEYIPVPN